MLDHYWLKMIPHYNTLMSRSEYKEYRKIKGLSVSISETSSSGDSDSSSEEEDDDDNDEENNEDS